MGEGGYSVGIGAPSLAGWPGRADNFLPSPDGQRRGRLPGGHAPRRSALRRSGEAATGEAGRRGGAAADPHPNAFEAPAAGAGPGTPVGAAAAPDAAAAPECAGVEREALRTALANERQMMANEVHDSLAQGLTYMRMRMSLLRDAIRDGDDERAFKYWSDVDSSLTNAHRRLRELITYFRSRMDPQGLLHALQEMTETFLDRTGVALEFANHVRDLDLPVGREVQVFHIVQEALANVCKHANARRARLTLERKGAGYEIVVEDDGVGMTVDPARRARRVRPLRHRDHARTGVPSRRRADPRQRPGGRDARAVILPGHGTPDRERAVSAAGPSQGANCAPSGGSAAARNEAASVGVVR